MGLDPGNGRGLHPDVSVHGHTFLLALGAALVAAVLGVGSAVAWISLPRRVAGVGRLLAAATLVQPPFLAANAWLDLTRGLRVAGNSDGSPYLGLLLTALVLGLTLWPIPALAVAAAWGRLPAEWLEAEPRSRGWDLLRRHLWPAARTSLLPALALVAVLAATQFTLPVLFQVPVLAETVWLRLNTRLDATGAALASLPLALAPFLLWRALGRPSPTWPPQAPVSERLPETLRARVGAGPGWTGGVLAAAAVGLGWLLPWYRLVAEPRTWTELPAALSTATGPALQSLVGAALGAVLAVAGGLAVVALRPTKPPGPGPFWLLFLLPGVVVSLGWIALARLPLLRPMSDTVLWIAAALGVRHLAPAWAAVRAAASECDPDVYDAARLDGSRWDAFRAGLWPTLRPRVLVVAYTVFLLALWDVESVVLVVPPGGETLALRIFNLLHYGHATQVNSLCLVLSLAGVAPWVVARLLAPRRERAAERHPA